MKNDIVKVQWKDSYGVTCGWRDISDFTASPLVITSYGKIIYDDEEVIAITGNYAEETENTVEQANGIMTIPKCCIVSITSLACDDTKTVQK